MFRRLISTLMIFVLMCSFCACTGQSEPQVESPDNPVASPDVPNAPKEDPSDPQEDPGNEKPPVEDPSSDPAADQPEPAKVSLDTVRTTMIDCLSVNDPLLLEGDMLVDLYGISADMLAQSAAFVTMSGTFPDEVILTEAVDDTAAGAIEAALQKRLDEVMVQSKTYDAENYAAAQQCKVVRNGLFIALILSPKQAEMMSVYESFFS